MTHQIVRRFMTVFGASLLVAAMTLLPNQARAQGPFDCPTIPVPNLTTLPGATLLPVIPSIDRDPVARVLRGTIGLHDAMESVPVSPPNFTTGSRRCIDQRLRFYVVGDPSSQPAPAPNAIPPAPAIGPTLRAKLGDVVELTLLNQIDVKRYPAGAIDQGQDGVITECDTASAGGYPNLGPDPTNTIGQPLIDTLPNCFHQSSTANLHFHGTHTSPTSTADNVYLAVLPSPRDPTTNQPVITKATFEPQYNTFVADCEKQLRANNLNQWPVTWPAALNASTSYQYITLPNAGTPPADWPNGSLAWTYLQAQYLVKYNPTALNSDVTVSTAKQWPQNYIGSSPSCFVLPDYKDPTQHLKMGQSPGTHWYHAHKHGSTSANVANGMTGAFIIEGDDYDGAFDKAYNTFRAALGLKTDVSWTRQQPVMVVDQIYSLPNLNRNGSGAGSGPFSVNGQQQPTMTMQPGEVKLWRIVNASPIDGFYLKDLPAGFLWQQTAQDGVQFDGYNFETRAQRPVYVAPGNRIDLLVKAPAAAAAPFNVNVYQGTSAAKALRGAPVPLMNVFVNGTAVTAMNIVTTAQLGKQPPFLADLSGPTNSRTFTFNTSGALVPGNGGQREHTINGHKFDPNHPVLINQVNSIEQWKIVNTTVVGGGIDHPFHIHINPFQVNAVFAPNAPMVYTNGQPVFDTAGKQVPLYVVAPAAPAYPQNQCVLDPNNDKTWVPCTGNAAIKVPVCGDPTNPAGWAKCTGPVAGKSTLKPTNIWWDVFPIPSAVAVKDSTGRAVKVIPGYFTMTTKFADYQGAYVMHCHILAHEDRGMMMSVQVGVNNPATVFAHH